mmetsp:Transcript_57497/g.125071  ORF Transcript_57497/g.125071 Transcript_57497/m.125071 type:complete len:341 (-) Transcript_57497:155-1177(-)
MAQVPDPRRPGPLRLRVRARADVLHAGRRVLHGRLQRRRRPARCEVHDLCADGTTRGGPHRRVHEVPEVGAEDAEVPAPGGAPAGPAEVAPDLRLLERRRRHERRQDAPLHRPRVRRRRRRLRGPPGGGRGHGGLGGARRHRHPAGWAAPPRAKVRQRARPILRDAAGVHGLVPDVPARGVGGEVARVRGAPLPQARDLGAPVHPADGELPGGEAQAAPAPDLHPGRGCPHSCARPPDEPRGARGRGRRAPRGESDAVARRGRGGLRRQHHRLPPRGGPGRLHGGRPERRDRQGDPVLAERALRRGGAPADPRRGFLARAGHRRPSGHRALRAAGARRGD